LDKAPSLAVQRITSLGIAIADTRLLNGRAAARSLKSPRANTAAFQNLSLFANMSNEEWAAILAAARPEVVDRGHVFHVQGGAVCKIVLVTSGSAKIVEVSPNGSEVILRMCGPGELLGVEVSTARRHSSGAKSVNSSRVLTWDAGIFERFQQRFPTLRANVVHSVLAQLRDLETRFREISNERVPARLSRQIIRLADKVGQQVSEGVEINLLREELAQLVGTTLFTVSRLLCEWSRLGIVKIHREAVIVCNRRALEEFSDRMGQMSLKR